MNNALILSGFLQRCLTRSVLRTSFLRQRSNRWALGCLFGLALAAMTATSWIIYGAGNVDSAVGPEIVAITNTGIPLTALAFFLVLRVLFLKSQSILHTTAYLPVTELQRGIAITVIEVSCTLTLTAIFTLASLSPLPYFFGLEIIPHLALSIIYPAVVTILLAECLSNLLTIRQFRRAAKLISLVATTALLLPPTALATTKVAEVTPTTFIYTDPFGYLGRHTNFWVATLAWLGIVIALTALAMVSAHAHYIHESKYSRVTAVSAMTLWKAYGAQLIRSHETCLMAVLTCAIMCLLAASHFAPLPAAIEVFTFAGLYSYNNTVALRMLPGPPASPLVSYFQLVVPLIAVAAPLFLVAAALDPSGLLIGLAIACTIPITVTVGILIPTERDNPFAVLTGMSIIILGFVVVVFTFTIFNLPLWGWACIGLAVTAIAIYAGIRTLKEHP